MDSNRPLSFKQLSFFFIPLGISSSLTSISHVIINGTLSRGENAAFIIACYAVAMSMFGLFERSMIIFRHTSSALVQDRQSFQKIEKFFLYVSIVIMSLSTIIAFSPIGPWMYTNFFNADDNMVDAISITYKVISIVIILSGIRGLYQGVIIQQLATNWLTIGVVVRLIGMFIISGLLIALDYVTSVSGALIFLTGMLIECGISVYKGLSLLKHEIKAKDQTYQLYHSDIARFYFPLVLYFFMQSILVPIIYILLSQANDIEMSIASFALAVSIVNMILGFFMYTHQLVIQFYKNHTKKKVIHFVFMMSTIPTLLLIILCYTPIGMTFMQVIMGADESLSLATIAVLKFFIIKTFIFPWVDFLNGFLMLHRQTNKMLFAQAGNLIVVILSLFIFVRIWPHLNGINGSIASALGEIAGFIIISLIVYLMRKNQRVPQHD